MPTLRQGGGPAGVFVCAICRGGRVFVDGVYSGRMTGSRSSPPCSPQLSRVSSVSLALWRFQHPI